MGKWDVRKYIIWTKTEEGKWTEKETSLVMGAFSYFLDGILLLDSVFSTEGEGYKGEI